MSGKDSGVQDIWNQVGARNTWAFSSSTADHDDDLSSNVTISDRFFSLRRKIRSNSSKQKCQSNPPSPKLAHKSKTEEDQENHNVPKSFPTALRKTKHIHIKQWLITLDLLKYEEMFNQYVGVEDLIDFSEAELKSLGVTRSADRALMISSLTRLRAKYYSDFNLSSSTRNSVAFLPQKKKNAIESSTESTYEQVQSKSLSDLIMDQTVDPSQITQDLRKDLEWELSLDSRDLRSHAWYHGSIPRARAEDIVREEGGFLVRDCTSQPGNYVLTCRTKTAILHFVIKKLVQQRDTVYEKVQFQFEEDAFDTVADLITYYVGSERAITAQSGARIQFPKNRLYPLSYYAVKYPTPLPSRYASPVGPYRQSPTRGCPPRLPSKKRSHSLTPNEVNRISQEKCNSADGVIQSPLMTRSAGADAVSSKFSTHSLPRSGHTSGKLSLSSSSSTLGRSSRLNTDSSLSPCEERKFFAEMDSDAPPKPSRVPTMGTNSPDLARLTSYHASGSDSGNGSGDSALSCAMGDGSELRERNCGVVIKNPRYMVESESSTTLKNYDLSEVEEKLLEMAHQFDVGFKKSSFDLDMFQTLLLPIGENKPLDNEAFGTIRNILRETGAMMLANHLTRIDLDMIFWKSKEIGAVNGVELCALPHGAQFRLDLLERTECLRMFVAVTILSCKYEKERTEMLSKWIEIAVETKTALGNLFGFCGIMLGLCSPKVLELDSTWLLLRREQTNSALNFEAKLRPTLKNMNTCSNPQAPNTTIPHLLPLILLLERTLDDFLSITETPPCAQQVGYIGAWESNTQDYGLGTLLNHLEMARKYMASSGMYQRNAEIVLGEARLDELTLDMFRTEFQQKFLWGSRGAQLGSFERHSKLEEILAVMAARCRVGDETEV